VPRRDEKPPDPIAKAFGAALRARRTTRRESLEVVAGRIQITGRNGKSSTMDPRYLGEIELGWHAPTIPTAKRIAEALETSLAELTADL
jgi:transcriptional regulator with XRE-family HTH domain